MTAFIQRNLIAPEYDARLLPFAKGRLAMRFDALSPVTQMPTSGLIMA